MQTFSSFIDQPSESIWLGSGNLIAKEIVKAMALNLTNCKKLEKLFGNDQNSWLGERITIYPIKTPFKGERVETVCIKTRPPKGSSPAVIPDEGTELESKELEEVEMDAEKVKHDAHNFSLIGQGTEAIYDLLDEEKEDI